MSVWISAILGHEFDSFSAGVVERLTRDAFPGRKPLQWRQISEWRSPEDEFARDGWVSFSVNDEFTLVFARRALGLV